ncbi:MAG TPA: hypothetical protein VJ790_21370 [Dongiaceae bacterium]|jgi:hypothetical protein|nr:hypothetical protein [Dongiaceae bacterium]
MRDYWLSKLFFDLQSPAAAEEYRANRERVLDRYSLKPEVRAAVERDDVSYLSRLVNPYLLRFYFHMSGMPEDDFLRRIRASGGLKSPSAVADERR